jgi:hypothetical protein
MWVVAPAGGERLASLGPAQRAVVQTSSERGHPAGPIPQSLGMVELAGVLGDAGERADRDGVGELPVARVILDHLMPERVQQLSGLLDGAAGHGAPSDSRNPTQADKPRGSRFVLVLPMRRPGWAEPDHGSMIQTAAMRQQEASEEPPQRLHHY